MKGSASQAGLGGFQTDDPLPDLNASDAASAIARAADITLVLGRDSIIIDVAVNATELVAASPHSWIGKAMSGIVSIESRAKIDLLMADELVGLRRWRQISHPVGEAADVPVEYAVIHVWPDGTRILAGRELSGVAALQQQLIATQQSMEREYARVRSAEARYRILFHVTAEAVLIVDVVNERVIDANPAATDLFDAKASRLTSVGFTTLLQPSDRDAVQSMLASVRATGSADQARVRSAGGRAVALSAALFNQADRTYFLIRAVSEESADKPTRPASRLVDIIDRMPQSFVVCDASGRILSANAAFVELTQPARIEQLRGEPLSRWVGRTGIETGVLFASLKQNHAVRSFTTVVHDGHGGVEDVEIAAVAVRTALGEECFGLAMRVVRATPAVSFAGFDRSVEQMTQLVGRMALKDLVRDATDMIERMCIEAALRLTDNNRASAAEMLGVSRQSLYNKMRRFDMSAPGLESDA